MFNALLQELADKGSVRFYVRAKPSAASTKVVSVMDDESIKVDIAAPPEDGKANRELVSYLAKEFGVPKANVEIVSGATARQKLIRITQ